MLKMRITKPEQDLSVEANWQQMPGDRAKLSALPNVVNLLSKKQGERLWQLHREQTKLFQHTKLLYNISDYCSMEANVVYTDWQRVSWVAGKGLSQDLLPGPCN